MRKRSTADCADKYRKEDSDMILIKNGYIKTMVGDDIANGCVLIGDDGKIACVAAEIEAPEGAQIIDAEGRIVTPGCIDAHCHIGLDEEMIGASGMDVNENSDPLTPHMRAIDAINPMDESFANAIKAGVTAGCTGPGSANVVGGTFAVIKLWGKRVDSMLVKDAVAMKCAFGENPKKVYSGKGKSPVTRMGNAAVLRELLFKSRRYLQDKEEGKNVFDMKLEAMIPVMKKEIPLKAHAHRADDIFTAIRIAKEFDLALTLDHCTDGALIAEELAAEGYPAFVGPSFGKKSKIELANKSFTTPAVLHKAGVPISIVTDAPVTPLHYLPMCAGLAVASGLDEDAAWRAITINPATYTGVGDRLGSLEEGKDADIVIWTSNPLTTIGGVAYKTIVDGKIVYEMAE